MPGLLFGKLILKPTDQLSNFLQAMWVVSRIQFDFDGRRLFQPLFALVGDRLDIIDLIVEEFESSLKVPFLKCQRPLHLILNLLQAFALPRFQNLPKFRLQVIRDRIKCGAEDLTVWVVLDCFSLPHVCLIAREVSRCFCASVSFSSRCTSSMDTIEKLRVVAA